MLVLSCKEQLKYNYAHHPILQALFAAKRMVQMFASLHDHHSSRPSYMQATMTVQLICNSFQTSKSCAEQPQKVQVR